MKDVDQAFSDSVKNKKKTFWIPSYSILVEYLIHTSITSFFDSQTSTTHYLYIESEKVNLFIIPIIHDSVATLGDYSRHAAI